MMRIHTSEALLSGGCGVVTAPAIGAPAPGSSGPVHLRPGVLHITFLQVVDRGFDDALPGVLEET